MDGNEGAANAIDEAVGAIGGAGESDNRELDGGEAFAGVGLTDGEGELEDVFGGSGDKVTFEKRADAERGGGLAVLVDINLSFGIG